MKMAMFMVLASFSLSTFAKIPGVPHELRRHFKSGHKFEETTFEYRGYKLKKRVAPNSLRTVLVYDIPSLIDHQSLIEDFALSGLNQNYQIKLFSKTDEKSEFRIYYRGKVVSNAFVKIYNFDEKFLAMGMELPYKNLEPLTFPNSTLENLPLTLLEGVLAERRVEGQGHSFPKASQLSPKRVVVVNPTLSKTGVLQKISIPKGTFPDQIQSDDSGNIWFTQPSNALLTRYDPVTKKWFHKEVGKGADGIGIDASGKIWFGEYFVQTLGMYDPLTDQYERYKLPYDNSSPAIPFEDTEGYIWLTDHKNNNVLRFDPAGKDWEAFKVPSSGSWPVDVIQQEGGEDLFVTECYANKFGHITKNRKGGHTYSEISLSISGCPAFLVSTKEALWSALWSKNSLIRYDLKSKEVTEYQISSDRGFGPVAKLSNGKIVFGSLSSGNVYLFDPVSETAVYVKGVGRLKDGLTVDKSDAVWVAERGPFIYKIEF
ncbi:MAG: hypothetical protein HOE90_04815 [Bacteriovoracaceae bacterium]|nr:hypothetical protein [Bacteriovoracaceae bacterium]